MTYQPYDVIKAMMQKGTAWESRLSNEDIEGVKRCIEENHSGVRFTAADVAGILVGAYRDDDVMERLLLETLDRFNDFDVFISDVRLRPGDVSPDPETLDEARSTYNAVLAQRLGLRLMDGRFEWHSPEQVVPDQAEAWAQSLPDFQVAEVAETTGVPVFPKDLLGILEPHYSRPDILKILTKQSVEQVKPLSDFLETLREWGNLESLDAATMVRTRHCYHALIVAGLKIDMAAEMVRREGDGRESDGIIEVLSAQYSRPDRIMALLDTSIGAGQPLAGFLADLASEGELGQLSTQDFARVREDYAALSTTREPEQKRSHTPEEVEDRPVVGKWTRQIGNTEAAGQQPTA